MAKILYIVLGILGLLFLIGFGMWFTKHPISRDKVLLKFDKKYFVLVASVVLAYLLVIAGLVSLEWIEAIRPDGAFKIALKYGLKMHEAKEGTNGHDLNIIAFIIIMLFQVVVVEGLVFAAIVGWTNRRIERLQKGQVRYSMDNLKGTFVSHWDSCDEIQKWWQRYWKRLCYAVYLKKGVQKNSYAVVVGANEVAPSVIKNLLKHEDEKKNSLDYAHEKENKYVILQTCSEIGEVRQTLKAYLTEDEYDHVIIYSDIRNSYEGLQDLHLEDASEIYVLGENTTVDGGETYHDTMNMRCVNLIADILVSSDDYQTLKAKEEDLSKLADAPENEEQRKRLQDEIDAIVDRFDSKKRNCKVLFEYQTTFSIFQFSDVPDKVHYAMHFIPFNRYESWARRVMVDNKALALVDESGNSKCSQQITYKPLDNYEGLKPNDTQRVHFIVVGMSKMGVAMGTQALFQAHYPNYVKDNSLKSRITFIDANAEQEMNFFKGRYATLFELVRNRYIDAKECKDYQLNSDYQWIDPMLDPKTKWKHLSAKGENFLDVEIEFVKGELESEKVREYLRQVTADKNSKVTIAICLPLTHQSVAAALYMPNEVYDNVQEIWVYQREAADIITNLEHARETNKRYEKLRPFGMLYGEYIDSRTHYLKALLVNAVYDMDGVHYKKNERDMKKPETYKDLIDSWNDLTVALQWSNKYFADSMYQKLRSMSKNEDCQDIMARCEHNRWNVQQLLLGFSPADEKKLEEFAKLNAALDDDAREQRSNWREKIGWNQLEPLQRKRKQALSLEYKKLPHGQYDEKKNELKHGPRHIHPNIVHYDLLNVYDSGAEGYDVALNNGITTILQLVDGYHYKKEGINPYHV